MGIVTIIEILAAVIGIPVAIFGAYVGVRQLLKWRNERKGQQSTNEQGITLAVPPPPPGMTHAEIKLTIDYVDGLPDAPPKIKDPFNEARKLEKAYKYREAIKQYEYCFQPETADSQRAALHILIGNCYASMSELEEAEGHYMEAEMAAKEANDNEGLAAALGNMGIVYKTMGELDKALDYHQQSLNINKEIGQKEGEASDLCNIGNNFHIKGEPDKALDYHQQSLKIEREIGRKEGEARQLGNIGLIYETKGELDKALEYHQQSLEIFAEIGAKIEIEKTKRNIQEIRKHMKSRRG